MRKAVLLLLVVGFIACTTTGCGLFTMHRDYSKLAKIETGTSPIITYFKDRFLDFVDWWGFKLQAGEGFLIHARATKLAQFGFGYFKGYKIGMKGREMGYWEEERHELGISILFIQVYINDSRKTPLVCNIYMLDAERRAAREAKTDLDAFRNDDRHWASIGINVHFGFIGFDIEFRLKEFFDFWLGIVTLDISGDDTVNRMRAKQAEFKSEASATEIVPQ